MKSIDLVKQSALTDTPMFLFDCSLADGSVEHWSTHEVKYLDQTYSPRILAHTGFEFGSSIDDASRSGSKVSICLANADSYFSQLYWANEWRSAVLRVRFLFFDLEQGSPTTESIVVFQGSQGTTEDITESTLRVSFVNRFSLQRVLLPEVRIQKRCPWIFPATIEQRTMAARSGSPSRYGKCGYSADLEGGIGNLRPDGTPYTSCGYTRDDCSGRGMFDLDGHGNQTRRFGGVEFVPPAILVRSYGESGTHLSPLAENEARYNDSVPLVYGTAWYSPPIVFGRNDGNLTRMEVLLCAGEIQSVLKVLVNDIEIPEAVDGAQMTATGWYRIISSGTTTGNFNGDFISGDGKPLGDPYGSMAALSVVVPNRINSGRTLPTIRVLLQGLKLQVPSDSGAPDAWAFSNNPAWVLYDVLRRTGWEADEIDVNSFALVAKYCDEPVQTTDLLGNVVTTRRYQCNLVVRKRRPASDLIKGIRGCAFLNLFWGFDGKLKLAVESSIGVQQGTRPDGTNSTTELNGGWPAFEFSDGSAPFSGIARKENGEAHVRFWSRPLGDSPNRLTVEFQDEFNEYQQDSLSLVALDAARAEPEISAAVVALGIPNFGQAARVARTQLDKSIDGNCFVEFGTSVRAAGLLPGDLIAMTYAKEGLTRQLFRVLRIVPGQNFCTAVITAQIHRDEWYMSGGPSAGTVGWRQSSFGIGVPRPLVGSTTDSDGLPQFSILESIQELSDGVTVASIALRFALPSKPANAGVAAPHLSLASKVIAGAGTLMGPNTLYYAISAADQQGLEGPLSFSCKALLAAPNCSVRLTDLRFSPNSTRFHVYRGPSPSQLLRIASDVPIADTFEDSGLIPADIVPPPDENFDHANFYWRLEHQTPVAATSFSVNNIGNSTLGMVANEHRGSTVRITRGRGYGQERCITANTVTSLHVMPAWDVIPDSSSEFAIVESSWHFGGVSRFDSAEFEIPNRAGATVEVVGRSANVNDTEAAVELSPITRWRIGGGIGNTDADVPPEPVFGLLPSGFGTAELVGIGFQELENTSTVTSGTFRLLYRDELSAPTNLHLSLAIGDSSVELRLDSTGVKAGDTLQIEHEVITVESVAPDGVTCSAARGAYQSPVSAHPSGSAVYLLANRTHVLPFAKGFFGSLASGSYHNSIFIPDVRIAAAELFVTNDRGNSPTARHSFTANSDFGVRTLSGGQFSIQIEGALGIQTNASPPILVEASHAVRDVVAVVGEATKDGEVVVRVNQDDQRYCDLTVSGGSTRSNLVNGADLPPLRANSKLTLDIMSVPQAPSAEPARDLTVTIRL